MRRSVAALLVLAVGVLLPSLAGCSEDPLKPPKNSRSHATVAPPSGGPGAEDAGGPTPGTTIPESASVDPELVEDIISAVGLTDAFWARHFADYFGGTYTSPALVDPETYGVYDGTDPNGPTCAGDLLGPGNAFYCSPEDYVAFDSTLLEDGFADGDSWVYLVIAHEWGHAIQARVGSESTSVAAELQADCLAAVALFGAAADGDLIFEDGDQREIAMGLVDLGDEVPWTQAGDHGDSFQRVEAFDAGRTGGVEACFA